MESYKRHVREEPDMNKEWDLPDINAAFDVVNRQLMIYHYKDDYKRYQELCRRRAALSVKLFTRDRRKMQIIDTPIDDYYINNNTFNTL